MNRIIRITRMMRFHRRHILLDITENMQSYLIETFWSEEDNAYLCIAPDLPGCCAAGDTPLEAIQEMQDAMASWLQACSNMGRELPVPLAKPRKAA